MLLTPTKIVSKILEIFPEFEEHEYYYPSDYSNSPHSFITDFYAYLSERFISHSLDINHQKIQKFFELILKARETVNHETYDFIMSGLFEGMHNNPQSIQFFESAAEKYLSSEAYRDFLAVTHHHVGNIDSFIPKDPREREILERKNEIDRTTSSKEEI